MIKEVGLSELVAYLAKESTQDSFSCSITKLQRIGNYIEKHDQTIRVEIGENSYRAFRSRSVRHIAIKGSEIEVDGIHSPVMQSLFRQYSPDRHVASLIKQALETIK